MTVPCQVAMIRAGPTGLGAALRLLEVGVHDFVLVDSALQAGGLASSCVDEQGFTWDVQNGRAQKADEISTFAVNLTQELDQQRSASGMPFQ